MDGSPSNLTVGVQIRQLRPSKPVGSLPHWPPDAFAIAAHLLRVTGAYSHVLTEQWPPKEPLLGAAAEGNNDRLEIWCESIADVALVWWNDLKFPESLKPSWKRIADCRNVAITDIRNSLHDGTYSTTHGQLIESLLQVLAAADEACSGVGVIGTLDFGFEYDTSLVATATELLTQHNDLNQEVDRGVVQVLPKILTPQVGFNLRSLSHNLALWAEPVIRPVWEMNAQLAEREARSLNLLLVPWPFELAPTNFAPAHELEGTAQTPESYNYFSYTPPEVNPARLCSKVAEMVEQAKSAAGSVDAVVFPELSMDADAFGLLSQHLSASGIMLMAGVAGDRINSARIAMPTGIDGDSVTYEQRKHHRWQLDRNQIRQYGLGGVLGGDGRWWEDIELDSRGVQFVQINDWLTMSVLICEDLARQDPVSHLVRAVGPNLVIAMLMDGPQIRGRWADRYASVLADDPGSSVLSFSCFGMVDRSKRSVDRSEVWEGGEESYRPDQVVGLWRDSVGGATELHIRDDSCGLLLSVSANESRQFTADGREAREYQRSIPVLTSFYQVEGPKSI